MEKTKSTVAMANEYIKSHIYAYPLECKVAVAYFAKWLDRQQAKQKKVKRVK